MLSMATLTWHTNVIASLPVKVHVPVTRFIHDVIRSKLLSCRKEIHKTFMLQIVLQYTDRTPSV